MLFVRGRLDPADAQAVALVGTRRATRYGLCGCRAPGRELAAAGVTVVSGLAKGVDTAAHQADARRPAAGRSPCWATGWTRSIRPKTAAWRAASSTQDAGAVVSEFAPGVPPDAVNFPRRNRIISGLSSATVIVEAGERSGALITADFALEQGREVMAVPGSDLQPDERRPERAAQAGRHAGHLRGRHPGRVFERSWPRTAARDALARHVPQLGPEETSVWQALGDAPRHVDELARALGVGSGQVSASAGHARIERIGPPGRFNVVYPGLSRRTRRVSMG